MPKDDEGNTLSRYDEVKDPPPQTREQKVSRALLIKQHRLGMNDVQFKSWQQGHEARVWAGDMGFMPEWKGWLA